MGRTLRFLATALVYFCVATVLAQTVGLGVVWFKGHLSEDRRLNLLAAAYDLPLREGPADPSSESKLQVVYADVLGQRTREALDLDLRASALDKAMADVLVQQTRLSESRRQYNELLSQFEDRLDSLEAGTVDQAILDVQKTLETLQPEQAKEQLLLMMDNDRLDDVVTLLKSMSADKQKKILNEFTDDEKTQLNQIIEKMLSSSAENDLIDGARQQLDQFRASQT